MPKPPKRRPRAEGGGPPGLRKRRTIVLAAVLGVLIGALGGGAGYLLTRHEGSGAAAGPGSATTAAPAAPAPSTPSPSAASPSAAPTGPAAATPAPTPTHAGPQLRLVQDPAGFDLLVPEGWKRRTKDPSVFYDSPDGTGLIQVFPMGEFTPYDRAVATDADLARNPSGFPGYHRIRLEQTPGGGAELEYAYNLGGGVRRVVDHILVGPDGQAHALLVAGPEASWPSPSGDLLHSVVGSFCLTGHCPSG
ncbi:hypothetical protein ACIRS1_29700 [Kitasatospora sp. NPDC101176]|uniref:hypothetical protein n=1 Tax=Kitasatospora sp. NPDC101176 TaxID=3364099 RepID=UPI0038156505